MELTELVEVLRLHRLWLHGSPNGKRANLGSTDLSWAGLSKANLSKADLSKANLSKAKLIGINLSNAGLRWVNLRSADLSEADLRGADLSGADLHGANLSEAILSDAKLIGIQWDHETVGIAPAPEGTLIGWGSKSGHIIKMRIEEDTPRSCATGRKFRAARVTVLDIDDGAVESFIHESKYGNRVETTYTVGQVTEADGWDEDRWNECSHGIHFFLSRHEAEMFA